ncbi:MAG: hypothetical protein DMD79_25685 [Candidatus Rokuibacteriota bacterium]|nr:MAG: hypothetical protein DMD79_25685 [Candidatus Rokubacteria bacterium]
MREMLAGILVGGLVAASWCASAAEVPVKKHESQSDKPASGTSAPENARSAPVPSSGLPSPLPAAPPASEGDYTLAPKDQVLVQVFGQEDLTRTVRIDQDGNIVLPMIGSVAVAGMTVAEASQKIEAALKQGGYLVNPRVTVSVSEYQGRQYAVVGAVNQPGTYPLKTRQTPLLTAISEARGVRENAEPAAYVVRAKPHDGEAQPLQVDLVTMVKSGDTNSVMIEPGDVVYVPEENTFYVTGEVEKRGAFTLKRDTTLSKAITEAGGATKRAASNRITVVRTLPSGEKKEITGINLDAVMKGDHKADLKLQAQDVVVVSPDGAKVVGYGILDFIRGVFSIGASVPVR